MYLQYLLYDAVYLVNRMCLNPGDLVNGRYKTIQELGRGGFGITYTAYDTWRSPLIVVLKQISITTPDFSSESARDSNYLAKLEAEAKVLQDLKHPCIPKFIESFEADNYYYIVQEYIEGHDLSQEIRPGEPISESEAISILREILNILQFVHQNNIIHRDIKPANIVRRCSDLKLFLIDFGAVKEVATEHTNDSGVTVTRIIKSEGYTPAEQLSGQPKQNSDIYALGMIIMQAVTGFSIYAICNPETIPFRNSRCNYIWQKYAPQISPKLTKIISQMIAYSFRDRYQTASEILLAIDNSSKASLWDKIQNLNTSFIQKQKLIKFVTLAVLACGVFILLSTNPLFSNNPCGKTGDNISCGEEILDPLSKGSIRFKAAQEYEDKQYQEASADYQLSWQKERRDAETLIYLNNSLLQASKLDYYTIAVAVPLSSDEKISIQNSKLAQNFLRGVAQAQTEVNLGLANKDILFKLLPGQEILEPKNITNNSNRGLRVVIVDDGNNLEQAQKTATAIAKMPKLLGVVGNYASEMTLATVDIYEKNNLAQVSFGTTTKRLSTNYRRNFFRVVYTNNEEAETVVKYIQSIDAPEKKVAGFYNPNSPFSNYFWIEIRDRLKQVGIPVYKAFNLADDHFNTQLALKEANEHNVNVFVLLPDGQVTNALSNAIEVIKYDEGKNFIIGGNSIVIPEVTQLDIPQPINLAASVFWHPFAPQNPQFLASSRQLWNSNIDKGTAVGYDAAIALIEALKLQTKPSRKGTIAELTNSEFIVREGATGSIKFNTPKNGDRRDFYPTLVRLFKCKDTNYFVPLSLDNIQAQKLACQTEE